LKTTDKAAVFKPWSVQMTEPVLFSKEKKVELESRKGST